MAGASGASRTARRYPWRSAAAFGVAAALAWTGGLVWFANSLPDGMPRDAVATGDRTDAIVVLTGGARRVEAGFDLLAAGRGGMLLITGVERGIDLEGLHRLAQRKDAPRSCCVVIDHLAGNTRGNAREAAAWMRRNGFTSLRLVTASYHMRRALLEFGRALPAARIVPFPVVPEAFKQSDWWRWPGTLSLTVSEYTKYLAALVRGGAEDALAALGYDAAT
ncbi:MAG: YdcF family protein [Alphaproteobacteria bacterium]|nr:YdcF family protein [Alphaproteobacteria bacterium]